MMRQGTGRAGTPQPRGRLRGFLMLPLCGWLVAGVASAEQAELETERDKALYAVGAFVGNQLRGLDLSEEEYTRVQMGVRDAALSREIRASTFEYAAEIDALQAERRDRALAKDARLSREFLAAAAARPGATRSASGVIVERVREGSERRPVATDRVRVHYVGRLRDGVVFDSTRVRGAPAVFPLDSVIACWSEALQLIGVGGSARITCPPALAYGATGHPPTVPSNAPLSFEVELLGIVE